MYNSSHPFTETSYVRTWNIGIWHVFVRQQAEKMEKKFLSIPNLARMTDIYCNEYLSVRLQILLLLLHGN